MHKYADPESIFKGEIGSLGNVRFVKSTEAKIFADESCPQFYQLTSDANFLKRKGLLYEVGRAATQKASVYGRRTRSAAARRIMRRRRSRCSLLWL